MFRKGFISIVPNRVLLLIHLVIPEFLHTYSHAKFVEKILGGHVAHSEGRVDSEVCQDVAQLQGCV